MDNTQIYYVYDENGDQLCCVRALDILEAYKEAELCTSISQDDLSVERS